MSDKGEGKRPKRGKKDDEGEALPPPTPEKEKDEEPAKRAHKRKRDDAAPTTAANANTSINNTAAASATLGDEGDRDKKRSRGDDDGSALSEPVTAATLPPGPTPPASLAAFLEPLKNARAQIDAILRSGRGGDSILVTLPRREGGDRRERDVMAMAATTIPNSNNNNKEDELKEPKDKGDDSDALILLKDPSASKEKAQVWGKLIPQVTGESLVLLSGTVFNIGRSSKCDLVLKDNLVSSLVCRILNIQGKVFVESSTSSGNLMLNQRTLRKQTKLQMRSGDEIVVTGTKQHSFIFSQMLGEGEKKDDATVGALPGPFAYVNDLPDSVQMALKKDGSDLVADFAALGDASSDDAGAEEEAKRLLQSVFVHDKKHEVRFEKRSEAAAPEVPALSSVELKSKVIAKLNSLVQDPSSFATKTTFENFPYKIDEAVKKLLINVTYIFLHRPEMVRFTKDIPSLNRRILLSGQKGSQNIQKLLMEALAHVSHAKLLVIDEAINEELPSRDKKEKKKEFVDDDDEMPLKAPRIPGLRSMLAPPQDLKSSMDLPRLESPDTTVYKVGDRVYFAGDKPLPPPPNRYGLFGRGARSALLDDLVNARPTSGPSRGDVGKVVLTFDDNARRVGVAFDKPIAGGVDLGGACKDGHGFFVDASALKLENQLSGDPELILIEALMEVVNESANHPLIVFFRDPENVLLSSYERYSRFKKDTEAVEGRVVFVGARVSPPREAKSERLSLGIFGGAEDALLDFTSLGASGVFGRDEDKKESKVAKLLPKLFPCKVTIHPPKDQKDLAEWNKLIEKDVEDMKVESNLRNLQKALVKNKVSLVDQIASDALKKTVLPANQVEKVIGWALSEHLMTLAKEGVTVPLVEADVLKITPKSVAYALKLLEESKPPEHKSIFDLETDNDFEKRLLSDVITPNEIKIKFSDVGALDKVKETLRELVMLPLQRPELFRKGNLTKPTKGILLFGPPGTGKTMLAKAVATEAGANFMSISMSSIGSKWFGEGEKYAKAVFSLASKIAPCVVFIDEVDAILGRRDKNGEHEAMRKIKNEFMMMWDGLRTKENERVLVLAATNRPFDLDEAVLRRLPRRLLVDLPDAENREKILKVILHAEELDASVELKDLSNMTDGFSGSDLKSFCVAAGYQPIRELLDAEKATKGKAEKDKEKEGDAATKKDAEGDAMDVDTPRTDLDKEVKLRALTMSDFKRAKNEVSASTSEDGLAIAELRKWNQMYGEGGNRKKETLSYFV